MSWPELNIFTVMVQIDTSKPTDSVSVDLGVIPPTMAVDALRQALESVSALVDASYCPVFSREKLIELPQLVGDSDDD